MRYRKDGFINKNTSSKRIENEQITFLLHKRALLEIRVFMLQKKCKLIIFY